MKPVLLGVNRVFFLHKEWRLTKKDTIVNVHQALEAEYSEYLEIARIKRSYDCLEAYLELIDILFCYFSLGHLLGIEEFKHIKYIKKPDLYMVLGRVQETHIIEAINYVFRNLPSRKMAILLMNFKLEYNTLRHSK